MEGAKSDKVNEGNDRRGTAMTFPTAYARANLLSGLLVTIILLCASLNGDCTHCLMVHCTFLKFVTHKP